MSKRRWPGRAAEGGPASSEEEEEEGPPRRQLRVSAAAAKRAPRRGALQLSQSTAGSGSSAGDALAVLLAGSRAAAAASGASRGAAAGHGEAAPSKARPRRGAGALKQSGSTAAGSSRQAASAAQAAGGPAAAALDPGGQGEAAAVAGKGELWVERHAPASEEGLVVHKKKVAEVREWLEEQRGSLGRPGVPRLLVVTGPPGCGKSTVLTLLARGLGFDVSEWRAPNAVQWEPEEHSTWLLCQGRGPLRDQHACLPAEEPPEEHSCILSLAHKQHERPTP